MPDSRRHRGSHPQDRELFSSEQCKILRAAVQDLSWLLGRGYNRNSAVKLVGDRYALRKRQRIAVGRTACSEKELCSRKAREVDFSDLKGAEIHIDGYNVLTTVEIALGGGAVLVCSDSTFRDMGSMSGTYRKVEETAEALNLLNHACLKLGLKGGTIYLDQPVSNSGRLKEMIINTSGKQGVAWEVSLVRDPDRVLIETGGIVASADSRVMDGCSRWCNLARRLVEEYIPGFWKVDLSFSH